MFSSEFLKKIHVTRKKVVKLYMEMLMFLCFYFTEYKSNKYINNIPKRQFK